jgi:hypothetical protein
MRTASLFDAAFNWLASRPSRIHFFVLACGLVAAAYQGIAP